MGSPPRSAPSGPGGNGRAERIAGEIMVEVGDAPRPTLGPVAAAR